MRKQALLGWKQPRRKCAQSCLHKKNARIVWATTGKIIHTRTDGKWKWAATNIHCNGQHENIQNKPKSTECQKSLMNEHSIIKVKDTCCLISFLPCFLVELILHAMATGSPLRCESQGVLRVAACESSFFSCVLFAFGLGLWQMLDADGLFWLWCSTWCCLIFLMTGVWPGERKSAEKDALLLHISGLLQVGLFLVAVHVIFPFVFCIWERAGNLKQEGDKGAERLHPYKQTKKECHWRWKQPATHAAS